MEQTLQAAAALPQKTTRLRTLRRIQSSNAASEIEEPLAKGTVSASQQQTTLPPADLAPCLSSDNLIPRFPLDTDVLRKALRDSLRCGMEVRIPQCRYQQGALLGEAGAAVARLAATVVRLIDRLPTVGAPTA